jgi:hypothetical protein
MALVLGGSVDDDRLTLVEDSGRTVQVVIGWREIFASLEAALDACGTVVHLLEGIDLERRRRPARPR